MSRWRKKPVVIDAVQWFGLGQHSRVTAYRNAPDLSVLCSHCNLKLRDHGWVETLEGGHIVCRGDFIITGVAGEVYPCKPDIFAASYEPIDDEVEAA